MSRFLPLLILCAVAAAGCSAPPDASPLEPLTPSAFAELQASLLFGPEDVDALRQSRAVLEPQLDEILDVWYGFVASQPHLLASFADRESGQPDSRYLAAVRERFGAWVLRTADANFDQEWLAWQLELGLRHHRRGKNRTDGVDAAEHIAFRHLVALQYPITATLRPFLEKGGHSPEQVDAMHEAWRKAVLLTAILWSQPYIPPRDY